MKDKTNEMQVLFDAITTEIRRLEMSAAHLEDGIVHLRLVQKHVEQLWLREDKEI